METQGSITDEYLAMISEVQDKRYAEALAAGQYDLRLYTAIDKAQIYRAGGRLQTAVQLFDSILQWTGPDELEFVSRVACLTRLEHDVVNGILHWDSVDVAMEACMPSPYKMLLANEEPKPKASPRSNTCSPGIYPSPLSGAGFVEAFPEESTRLVVLDVSGRVAWDVTLQSGISVPAERFAAGLFTYTMLGSYGSYCTGKLVVAP